MDYKELVKLISAPRLQRYLICSQNNQEKAVELYFNAVVIAGNYFALISLFEVILRNKINQHFTNHFISQTDQWLLWLGQKGSILDRDNTKITFDELVKTVGRLERSIKAKNSLDALTNDRVVAGLSFGFWNGLFYKPEFNRLEKSIINIFPAIPLKFFSSDNPNWILNKKRTLVSEKLNTVCAFRNRIAYQEPIIIAKDNTVYFRSLDLLVTYIKQLTEYMGEDSLVYDEYIKIIDQQKTRIHNLSQR